MGIPNQETQAERNAVVFVFVVLWALWLAVAGRLTLEEVLAGFLVSAVVTAVARPRLAIFNGLRLNAAAPMAFVRYLGYFLWALVKANADMARRVLTPSLPLRPAVVEVETSLESDLGRLVLANSITLTPGTLSVDVRENRVLVHWVDCAPGTDLQLATREIASGFERHLKGFLK